MLSSFDTWHRCGLHAEGAPHPEDEEAPYDPERKVRLLREAFRTFRTRSGLGNLEFYWACLKAMCRPPGLRSPPTPQEWVDAAEKVTEEILNKRREEKARAQGYTCDLERQLHEEADREAFDRF